MTGAPVTLDRDALDLASVFDGWFGAVVYCLTRDRRFTYVNPTAAALLGWERAHPARRAWRTM